MGSKPILAFLASLMVKYMAVNHTDEGSIPSRGAFVKKCLNSFHCSNILINFFILIYS